MDQAYLDSEFPVDRIMTPRDAFELGAKIVWLYDIDGNGVVIDNSGHQLSERLGRIILCRILENGSVEVTLEQTGDIKRGVKKSELVSSIKPPVQMETPAKVNPPRGVSKPPKPQRPSNQVKKPSNAKPEVIEAGIARYETPSLNTLLQQQAKKPRPVPFEKFQMVISNMAKYYPVHLHMQDEPVWVELLQNLPYPEKDSHQNTGNDFDIFRLGVVVAEEAQETDAPYVLTIDAFLDFHKKIELPKEEPVHSDPYTHLAENVHNEQVVVAPVVDVLKGALESMYDYFTRSNFHYEIEDLCPAYTNNDLPEITTDDIELSLEKIDEVRDLVADLNEGSCIFGGNRITIFEVVVEFIQNLIYRFKKGSVTPEVIEISEAELDDLKEIANKMEREIHQSFFEKSCQIEPSKSLATKILRNDCDVVIRPIKMPMRSEKKI